MTLSTRQKATIAALAVYWPVIAYLAHIPIPDLVYRARVSDKWLHFLVYLILAFLLWFSVSPVRVNLRRRLVWWIILVLAVYGGIDEITQGWVGRTCDTTDFLANVAGIVAGLVIFAFLDFWPAMLAVTAVVIFGLTNLARADISQLLPVANAIFHLAAYGVLTLLWHRVSSPSFRIKGLSVKEIVLLLIMPACFLGVVKFCSAVLGRYWQWRDIGIALAGIVAAIGAIEAAAFLQARRRSKAQS